MNTITIDKQQCFRYFTFCLFLFLLFATDSAQAQNWETSQATTTINNAAKFAYIIMKGLCGCGALFFLIKIILNVFVRGEGAGFNNISFFVVALIIFFLIKPMMQNFFGINIS